MKKSKKKKTPDMKNTPAYCIGQIHLQTNRLAIQLLGEHSAAHREWGPKRRWPPL
jgi:hypothetical protein